MERIPESRRAPWWQSTALPLRYALPLMIAFGASMSLAFDGRWFGFVLAPACLMLLWIAEAWWRRNRPPSADRFRLRKQPR
jgi:hypothetical protein